jgi:MFS family permease
LFLLALADEVSSRYEVPLMIAISVIAVLDNGLEATAITEFAGQFWSGRALGVQNTTQRLMAAAGPPLFGALIAAAEYPSAWALCGLFPLVAIPLVPTRLLPPGLETTARLRSVRRLRWWRAVRSGDLPDKSRRPGPPAQRHRPGQDGQAVTPPT